jgi:hypothetical protein
MGNWYGAKPFWLELMLFCGGRLSSVAPLALFSLAAPRIPAKFSAKRPRLSLSASYSYSRAPHAFRPPPGACDPGIRLAPSFGGGVCTAGRGWLRFGTWRLGEREICSSTHLAVLSSFNTRTHDRENKCPKITPAMFSGPRACAARGHHPRATSHTCIQSTSIATHGSPPSPCFPHPPPPRPLAQVSGIRERKKRATPLRLPHFFQ